ncbi:MAG: glucosyl-3-phosphoglycerate synthase [Anaerolineaceae bacterium]
MKTPFRKVKMAIVPVGTEKNDEASLTIAKALAREVILVGIVAIEKGESVSAGAQTARAVRKRLMKLGETPNVHFKSTIIVSETPWRDMEEVITREKPELIVVDWGNDRLTCGLPLPDVLSNSLVDVIVVRGSAALKFQKTLVAVRGGPHAELALKTAITLKPDHLDVLHISLTGADNDAPFKGYKKVLTQIPEINPRSIVTDDVSRTLFEEAEKYDLVILGTTASGTFGGPTIGPVAAHLLHDSKATILVTRNRQEKKQTVYDESAGAQAISILVDKWFAENTYHSNEFTDLERLLELKQASKLTISLAMPALNEEKTVGKVISKVKTALMDEIPLLDEMVLIDSNSSDKTREIAEDLGVKTYIHQEILPDLGARAGKGEALWKSLLVTKGDLIAWIDTDIVNIRPHFVYGILGPLLVNPNVQFVKGFYKRPLKVGAKMQAGSGGRVTELTARPLLNLFYPELSGVIQPLSGEYAGRRKALEGAVFYSGYGVETGLLIDIFERYGLSAIAQVDLLERIHHNQELEALSKMSFAIIQTVLHKLETRYERSIIEDVNKTMKLIRYADGEYFLDIEEIAEKHRPPMNTLAEYQETHKK